MINSNNRLPKKHNWFFKILFISFGLCLFAAGTNITLADSSQPFAFTILHTNDLHAHDESFLERGKMVGGMPRIAHLIRQIKKQEPHVVVIDAGDIFQGTHFFKFYHGQIEVDMLNQAGYDIYTIGNHEFDEGSHNLAKQLKNAKFDIISSNLEASAVPELKELVKASVVKKIGGEKVGFVGAITPSLPEVSLMLEGVTVKAKNQNWLDPISEEIKKLKAEGINKIVLVTHVGVELDKQAAETLEDVDIIIGGHSHTRLSKPIIISHKDGSKCFVVQTGCYGRSLGELQASFDKDGRIIADKTKYSLIDIDNRIAQDSDIHEYLLEKEKPFAEMHNTAVAVSLGYFDNHFRNHPNNTPLGDLICDAFADYGAQYKAHISLQNRGGIRSWIDRGIITQETVDELLPFENHLKIATVSGRTLYRALEHSVSGTTLGGPFLEVHGLKFTYSHNKEPGKRISKVQAINDEGQLQKLDLAGKYRIAINDYSFGGGEGYDFSDAQDIVDTGKKLSDIMDSYLIKVKRVSPRVTTRITAAQ